MAHSLADAGEYLVSVQNEDGSWGAGDPLVCARALYALQAIEGNEDALLSGLKFLENSQASDGHFPAKSKMYSDAANTAYTLVVLNRFDYGKASLPVTRGIIWLLEHQAEDGSWGGSNTHKRAYTTALCLRALNTYYMSGIERFAKGLAYVIESIKQMDFYSEPISHVYAPVLHLKRIDYLDEVIESRFLDYALNTLGDAIDEGRVADVAYLLGTLNAMNETEMSEIAAEWMETAQNEDGGFGKDLQSGSDPNWTALAILAMRNKL
jgi:squalene cyclase